MSPPSGISDIPNVDPPGGDIGEDIGSDGDGDGDDDGLVGGNEGFEQGAEEERGDFRTGFEESVRRREAIESAEERVLSQSPLLTEQDVAVRERDGRLEAEISDRGRRKAALDDITDGEDISREDIESLSITDEGVEAEFTDEFREEQAIDQIVEENEDISRGDVEGVEFTDEGAEPVFSTAYESEQVIEQVTEDPDIGRGDIAAVYRSGGEWQVSFEDDYREEQVVENILDERPDLEEYRGRLEEMVGRIGVENLDELQDADLDLGISAPDPEARRLEEAVSNIRPVTFDTYSGAQFRTARRQVERRAARDLAPGQRQAETFAALATQFSPGQFEASDFGAERFEAGEEFEVVAEEVTEADIEGAEGIASFVAGLPGVDADEIPQSLDVEPGTPIFNVEVTEEGEQEIVERQVAGETGLEAGEEFEVVEEDGEQTVELTEEGEIEMASREGFLEKHAAIHRTGEGWIPNLEGFVSEARKAPGGAREGIKTELVRFIGNEGLNPAGLVLGGVEGVELGVDAGSTLIQSVPVAPGGLQTTPESVDPPSPTETAGAIQSAVGAAETAFEEDPQRFIGTAVGLGLISGVGGAGIGKVGKRGYTALRGRLATRGLDFKGEVPIEQIERPDVRQGSGLTRLSDRAAPEGGLSMPAEQFPVTPSSDVVTELRRLSREFDDPRIRRELGVQSGEDVVYRAVSGRKGEVYEPRSRRPYDPDATFFAPSVARNFLNVRGSGGRGGGIRRPKPLSALVGIYRAARGKGTPNIIATAGEIRPFPTDVQSLADRTRFLQQRRNTGELYAPTRKGQQTVSGEAEVMVSAEGATSTEPMRFGGKYFDPDEIPGTGVVESGETTRLTEAGDPFYTRIKGERVPIQLYRQDPDAADVAEDVGEDAAMAADDDSGSLLDDLLGAGDDGTTPSPSDYYEPGGQPGTPYAPVPASPGAPAAASGPAASVSDDAATPSMLAGITESVADSPAGNVAYQPSESGFGTAPGTPSFPIQTPAGSAPASAPEGSPVPTAPESVISPMQGTPGTPSTPSVPSTPSTPGSPTSPTQPTAGGAPPTSPTRAPRLDLDFDDDERRREDEIGELRDPEYTGYYDPLVGDLLYPDVAPVDAGFSDVPEREELPGEIPGGPGGGSMFSDLFGAE